MGIPLLALLLAGALQDEESRLIAILESDQGPAAKDRACLELRRRGTAKAVPALARLLGDELLSHSARVALEAIPGPEPSAALREALRRVSGPLRLGIIDSLGTRRDREAVPLLVPLAADPDPETAAAAAAALGEIGGPEALRVLRKIRPRPADALLRGADRAVEEGDGEGARSLYRELSAASEPEHVRTAAHLGLFRTAGEGAVALVESALAGEDRAAWRAAIPWVRETRGEAATRAFAALLPRLAPDRQVALLEALEQRGDPAAAPACAAAVASPSAEVRRAALQAVGTLGDASAAPLLAEAAAHSSGPEQAEARRALDRIRDPRTAEALLGRLADAPVPVQVEIAQALGRRQDASAAPALLKMAEEGEESVRLGALRSLAVLADGAVVGDLIRLLGRAGTDAEREAAERALAAAAERGPRREASRAQVLESLKKAEGPLRAVLLRVAGRLGGSEALAALRAGLEDREAAVREAALRALAEFAGPEAAPDLLRVARQAGSATHHVLALRGYWRLVGREAGRPLEERWAMCRAGLEVSRRPEERKLGLTELAKVPHPGALELAEKLCAEEAVREEAEAACVRIAAALAGARPEAKAALRRIAAASKNEAIRGEAGKVLVAAERYSGYVPGWLAAGPYREAGKTCQELFDIPFAPEMPGRAVEWKPAPRPADPALFWQADLGPVVAGDHAVVYLKARVRSPREARARLEIGTDDGVKVWVNGRLVHANNAIRGLTPGQDRAEAVLREGDNEILLKVTQHTLGCGACVRIRAPDGSALEGLEFP